MSTFATTPGRPVLTPTQHTTATVQPHGEATERQTVADALSNRTNLVMGGDDMIIVPVAGDIDLGTLALLHTRLIEAIDRGYQVCCDLSQVSFLGAAGANTLLVAHCHATACGRRLSVRGAHGVTRRVITTTGLDRVLTIQD